ncbi:pmpB [Symbiodinium sp. CCMP2456]|nr:pmpB [Symbiodinium sp. CCMP2456]
MKHILGSACQNLHWRGQRVFPFALRGQRTLTSSFTDDHVAVLTTGEHQPPIAMNCQRLKDLVEDARSRPTRRHQKFGLSKSAKGYQYRSTLRGWSTIVAAAACRRDREKGRQSNIDMHHLLDLVLEQGGLCAYSGIPMELLKPNSHWRASIERIDTNQGYRRGNCCLIAAEFNSAVHNASHEAGTSSGSAQWSKQKVGEVARIRTEDMPPQLLQEAIAVAKLRPGSGGKPAFAGDRGPDAERKWRCTRCELWKHEEQFYKQASRINVVKPLAWCKQCYLDSQSIRRKTLRGHGMHLLSVARHRAAAKAAAWHGTFKLDWDDLLQMLWLQGGRCYYSGVPLCCAAGPADWVWSIERLDNSVTYTRENCVLIAQEFQTSDYSRNSAKYPVFGTAQWSRSKASHIWGPYVLKNTVN